ncbi:hypothetical protein BN1012_Phect877 [Candidatus Phaeomarinobacter ectocarpi]|uniref:Methyltransferase FkbM domain-containing protein n=1 Tax=Candidatus Phaeomarinibacter ectocarpi TaxID=1458461 RepID=X5MMA5_9HYPH|nr:hypothetical protein BN1012_Phect877 [Candidatus Phaeomarinobacter ectocarpi]
MAEPANGYESKTRIDTMSLEQYLADNGLDNIRLLKLEAEGLEPEILIGCGEALGKIDYIAVDGGEERGLKSEETLSTVANYLIHRGFDLLSIDIKARMGRALFRRAGAPRQSQPPAE